MKNVMVTGGAGFIGSWLCEALLGEGLRVVCVDNLQRGTEENIRSLRTDRRFAFLRQDAADAAGLAGIMEEYEIDYVFHLAANTDLWESEKAPELEYASTFRTTWAVLEAMRATGVRDLFFASSSAVYGEQTGGAFTEGDPLRPISYYGAAKAASEMFIHAVAHMSDMNALIFRFSNIIGGRMTHGVIRDFILRLNRMPDHLDVRGNGFQTKPYCHVTELIRAIRMLAGRTEGVEIFNVGASTGASVRFIAETVVAEMGLSGIPIRYEKQAAGWKGDVAVYEYNIDRIRALGWTPEMTSDETVRLAVKELVSELKQSAGE